MRESQKVKRSSSHVSDAFSSFDVDPIKILFHQLHTSSNAAEKKQGKTIKESEQIRVLGGRLVM
jgi:hypothetical protein